MRNLFLTIALFFAVSLSFAEPPEQVHCIHVSLSCGVEYDICNFQGSMGQLIQSVLFMDDFVCN